MKTSSSNNIVYVDGSATPNKASEYSRGSAAAVLVMADSEKVQSLKIIAEFFAGFETVTNNRMELRAIELAARSFPKGTSFRLSSDSKYALYSIFGNNAINANRDIIEDIKDIIAVNKLDVTAYHIGGHSGAFLNELADYAARESVERERTIHMTICPKDTALDCLTCTSFPKCKMTMFGGRIELNSWKQILKSLKEDEWKSCPSRISYLPVVRYLRPNSAPSGSIRS